VHVWHILCQLRDLFADLLAWRIGLETPHDDGARQPRLSCEWP
jgi:hypothetical protein